MIKQRIFISSAQKEFAEERQALREYVQGDPLLRRFFDAFLFEEVPAADRRADELYLTEIGVRTEIENRNWGQEQKLNRNWGQRTISDGEPPEVLTKEHAQER